MRTPGLAGAGGPRRERGGVQPTPTRGMTDTPTGRLAELVLQGYAAQCADRLDEAEACYRAALALNPETFDALHMLGVVRLQRGDADEATRLLLRSLPQLRHEYPPVYQNLGLCLAAVALNRGAFGAAAIDNGERAFETFVRPADLPARPAEQPLVSIVLPRCGDRGSAAAALLSVADQTYRRMELIVVEGGSQESDASALQGALASFPFEVRRIGTRGCSPAEALNEGVEAARGTYIGVIECDGRYRRGRVETFMRALSGRQQQWGFSNVAFINERDDPVRFGESLRVDAAMRQFDAFYSASTLSEVIIGGGGPLVAGNLFFSKSLWRWAGGFPDLQVGWAWAFCLAALPHAEPVYVDEPAYVLAVGDDIEDQTALGEEKRRILDDWERMTAALDSVPNTSLWRLLRQRRRDRDFAAMKGGLAHQLDRSQLLRYAAELGFGSQSGGTLDT